MRRWLLLAMLASCGRTSLGDGPRKAVVRGLVDGVILPTYSDAAARAEELKAALDVLEFNADGDHLLAAQAAWRAARAPWKETEAFAFGPAADSHLAAAIDQWPPDPAGLDRELDGTAELTDEYVAALGANKKGFHGIEHVLFGGIPDERRLRYLAAAGRALAADTARLRAEWTPYATRFIEAGDPDAIQQTIKLVVDTFVNEGVALSERVADTRLGGPMGKATGGLPRPDLAESPDSDNSAADMASSLRGLRNIYFGSRDGVRGHGLDSLVAASSPVINKAVSAEVDAALAATAALPGLDEALASGDPRLDSAYAAVKELKRGLATDVTGALGATLKFNENDGD